MEDRRRATARRQTSTRCSCSVGTRTSARRPSIPGSRRSTTCSASSSPTRRRSSRSASGRRRWRTRSVRRSRSCRSSRPASSRYGSPTMASSTPCSVSCRPGSRRSSGTATPSRSRRPAWSSSTSEVQPQAYRLGERAWAVQFHPEARRGQVLRWFEEDEESLPAPLAEIERELEAKIDGWHRLGRALCLAFLAEAATARSGR